MPHSEDWEQDLCHNFPKEKILQKLSKSLGNDVTAVFICVEVLPC